MRNLIILSVLSVALAGPVSNLGFSESDVNIFLYTQTDPKGVRVNLTDAVSVQKTSFDATKETVFVTHGWHNDHLSPACQTIKDALLDTQDINIFLIDWSPISSLEYNDTQPQVYSVGTHVGQLIESMVANNNLQLETTSMAGHSLGSHVVGIAGKVLGGQLKSIVGLDPALPNFSLDETENRLNKGDARFVQIIHTCAGFLGFNDAIGDADYWPNDGVTQPGCESDTQGSCDHGRAFLYYAESLASGNFDAIRCNSATEYDSGNCSGPSSYLGEFNLDMKASGNYYLKTNSESPFARGRQ